MATVFEASYTELKEKETEIERLRALVAEYEALFGKLPRLKDHLKELDGPKD